MARHRSALARPAVALLAIGLAVGGMLWARSALGLEWSVASVRGVVESLGLWAPLGFVLLVALRSPLLLPSQLILTVAGLCFGVVRGTLYGGLGLLLSGLVVFSVVRWMGAELLRERVPGGLRRTLEAAGRRGGAALLAAASAYPVGPVTLVQAAAGMVGMGWASFVVAAGAGSLVRAWLYAYFGNSLVEGRLAHVGVALALLALCLLPLGHPRVRAWLRNQLRAEPTAAEGEALKPAPPRADEVV
jgi:uncharacterized membrane protein YdjX (TVP38/TMEM64 family)